MSRVLNSHRSVSPEVRERVVEAIRALGYEPDAVAQSMRLRTTRTVACAIRDISIAGFGSFVKAAEEVLRHAGYTLLLTNTDEQSLAIGEHVAPAPPGAVRVQRDRALRGER